MRSVVALLAVVSFLAVGVGCDKTISERETTRTHRDGTVTKSTETVKEKPDGTIRVEKERSVDRD